MTGSPPGARPGERAHSGVLAALPWRALRWLAEQRLLAHPDDAILFGPRDA
jgi:hypothetical protein